MSAFIWASTSSPSTNPNSLSWAAQTAGQAVAEHRASSYYAKWVRDNKVLGPAVDAYLAGVGPRPSETLIGRNHYGRALVLTEDIRRNG